LVDGALVAVDGFHHAFEDRVEQLPGLLGVTVREQLHRPLEVGEQHGDLLALAFERRLGSQDLLGEVLRGIGLWCGTLRGNSRSGQRGPTLAAEPLIRGVRSPAGSA
jgi:hypothetical protein